MHLSGPILNEKVTIKQWIGVLLGFIGAALVLGLDIGVDIPLLGLIATISSFNFNYNINALAKKIK